MRIRFVTSTPLDISRGSGTFVGISAIAQALRQSGVSVELRTPSFSFPIYTFQRLLFNEALRFHRLSACDVTIGFDMDGYALARRGLGPHIASIKGVIADEMRFESGFTKATMGLQAACERAHVAAANLVITTSRHSAERIQELYELPHAPHVVPELIDLTAWNSEFHSAPDAAEKGRFIVLCVCRFYRRKRVHLLLRAAARLRSRLDGLEIRIVGGGPECDRLKRIWREERLEEVVAWRENISRTELLREYKQCCVFCLPSVQEGFGIVFLEAMASGKPIIAARAGPMPNVVPHALLVEPDSEEALAAAIERLYHDNALRSRLGYSGLQFVQQFDAPVVGRALLREIALLVER
jgi:glycosyltransferase involved in cell wall biosynthesis